MARLRVRPTALGSGAGRRMKLSSCGGLRRGCSRLFGEQRPLTDAKKPDRPPPSLAALKAVILTRSWSV